MDRTTVEADRYQQSAYSPRCIMITRDFLDVIKRLGFLLAALEEEMLIDSPFRHWLMLSLGHLSYEMQQVLYGQGFLDEENLEL